MGVNLMGVVHGVRVFVPRMLAGGDEGHIVNIASVAGLLTGSGPYFASKHGVACLTEGLYKDLKSAGSKLSALVLCPGLIRTGILDAECNRPADMGPATDLAALSETSQRWAADFRAQLEAGYDPAMVADAVADVIVTEHFYIVPAQPNLVELIRTRMRDIVEQRNPTLAPASG
jgi:NAD(P)-dependent dehydrogenase (short-subunit alcohol dehydrogenase family)